MDEEEEGRDMNAPDYKNEIIQTRVGGLGSSDAAMVMRVGQTGAVGYGARERLAQMMGLVERPQFSTPATKLGDLLENEIYSIIRSQVNENAVNNPLYIHKALTEEMGYKIQDHIDFEIETDTEVIWYECKASIKPTMQVYEEYTPQLIWHSICLKERAGSKNERLFLVHYDTKDWDGNFDAERLHLEEVSLPFTATQVGTIVKGLRIIRDTLSDNFTFTPKCELECSELPEEIRNPILEILRLKESIKKDSERIDEFKARMLPLMTDAGVDKIFNDLFAITRVKESVSVGFDSARFKADNPELYAAYCTKRTEKTAYILIKDRAAKKTLITK